MTHGSMAVYASVDRSGLEFLLKLESGPDSQWTCMVCLLYITCFVTLQSMAGACLFLAAKVEEQPRKLEHVIRTGYMCTHRDQPPLDVKSDVSARYCLTL